MQNCPLVCVIESESVLYTFLLHFFLIMTTFLTKKQREVLIDWYIDCLIETDSEFLNGSEEDERKSLASMNNSYFYEYVQDLMPECMKDLKKLKI